MRNHTCSVFIVPFLAIFLAVPRASHGYLGGGRKFFEKPINDLISTVAAESVGEGVISAHGARPGMVMIAPILIPMLNVAGLVGRANFHSDVSIENGKTTFRGIAWVSLGGAALANLPLSPAMPAMAEQTNDWLAVFQIMAQAEMPCSAAEASSLVQDVLPLPNGLGSRFDHISLFGLDLFHCNNLELSVGLGPSPMLPEWLTPTTPPVGLNGSGQNISVVVIPDPCPFIEEGDEVTASLRRPALVIVIVAKGQASKLLLF